MHSNFLTNKIYDTKNFELLWLGITTILVYQVVHIGVKKKDFCTHLSKCHRDESQHMNSSSDVLGKGCRHKRSTPPCLVEIGLDVILKGGSWGPPPPVNGPKSSSSSIICPFQRVENDSWSYNGTFITLYARLLLSKWTQAYFINTTGSL